MQKEFSIQGGKRKEAKKRWLQHYGQRSQLKEDGPGRCLFCMKLANCPVWNTGTL